MHNRNVPPCSSPSPLSPHTDMGLKFCFPNFMPHPIKFFLHNNDVNDDGYSRWQPGSFRCLMNDDRWLTAWQSATVTTRCRRTLQEMNKWLLVCSSRVENECLLVQKNLIKHKALPLYMMLQQLYKNWHECLTKKGSFWILVGNPKKIEMGKATKNGATQTVNMKVIRHYIMTKDNL